jgi:hypothetical protein
MDIKRVPSGLGKCPSLYFLGLFVLAGLEVSL